jgi:tyrosine-protein kinase Etk/Wzc
VLNKDGKILHPCVIFNGVSFLKKYGYGYGGARYGYGYAYGQGYGYEVSNGSKKRSGLARFFMK